MPSMVKSAKLWEFETETGILLPAIGSEGTVYVGSRDKAYAINGKTGVKLGNLKREIMCPPPCHRL